MPAEHSRAQRFAELKMMLDEVARLSDRILALRAEPAVDEEQLKQLSAQWIEANLKAAELRRELESPERH